MASPLVKRPSRSTGAGDPPLSLRFEAADPDYLNRLNVDLAVLGHDLVDAGDLRRWEKIKASKQFFGWRFIDHGSSQNKYNIQYII